MASLTKLIISSAIRAHKQAVREEAKRKREAERARKAHARESAKRERERERDRRELDRHLKAEQKLRAIGELEALKQREEETFEKRRSQREQFKLKFLREVMK